MIEESRIQPLNKNTHHKGQYVLYWMQASQRAECNQALDFAIFQANQSNLPVIVYFGLTDNFPEGNARHYYFMLEGLIDVRDNLRRKCIGMVIEKISPERGIVEFAKRASMVVCDRGYLQIQKKWRDFAAVNVECPMIQVESDVVVPVEVASNKEEYSAATLRRKLQNFVPRLSDLKEDSAPRIDSTRLEADVFDISNIPKAISELNIDHSIEPSPVFRGGTEEAKKHLNTFIRSKLDRYEHLKNDPNEDVLSQLSPYLHFGQISPLYVASEVGRHGGPNGDTFLEELIVRRELSMNFVQYNPLYDSFTGLPDWAQKTLLEHQEDPRKYLYSRQELEKALTHDPYWNAAQRELIATGKMHGYMRMYWGKKILEWTSMPQDAFMIALYLNNKYELDGRDPNGFTGVAWCFGKHDRPWAPHPIFGYIRYMSEKGLQRKFDAERYARKYSSKNP
jgi:deoxyribodipyrimidine photo-lyase